MFAIRYSSIRSLDVSNGKGVGISLFLQGCSFQCEECFNKETWDVNGGEEWTTNIRNRFLMLLNKPYIERVSILGGDPLHRNNLEGVLSLINEIRISFGKSKTIWLYSGYTWREIFSPEGVVTLNWFREEEDILRKEIVSKCDVFVDGKFVKELADVNYKWAGSTNQKVIDVKKSLESKEVILYG